MVSKKEKQSNDSGIRKWPLWVVLLCAAAGGWLAFYSTSLTFKVIQEGLVEPSGCSVNEWISCDAVYTTSYALLLDVPVAWLGLLFYVWIFLASLAAILSERKRAVAVLSFSILISFAAIIFSALKAYHLTQIGVLCPVCVGMYVINAAIFVLLLNAHKLSLSKAAAHFIEYFKRAFGKKSSLDFQPQPVFYLALLVSLFSLGYISIDRYTEVSQKSKGMAKIIEQHFAQKPVALRIDAEAAVWGNPDAELSLIEYSDFQCPGCRFSAFHLRSVLFEYRNHVRLFFMNYPLDTSINSHVQRNIHPFAGLAARAGVCGHKFGDFWGMHDDLFRNQNNLSRNNMLQLAASRNWDITKFEICLDDSVTFDRVKRDIVLAKEVGVRSTPSLFINGRLAKYWNSDEFVREVVKRELEALD